jgi:hypothetical protein
MHSEAFREYCANNATVAKLHKLLDSPGVCEIHQKATIVRTQLAQLGVYRAACPDRDALLSTSAC